ncbi:MAG: antibiotic biosynthesis monooxygenase [Gammaproteobacteria bacterium]|nr:antibiotic biosynthesis monooxygenase [Gammaproteobacteria bacterium]|tara:strand:+ start:676 stop:972 length:297 start_codon:yes stop_codon:yes gene_type:complete
MAAGVGIVATLKIKPEKIKEFESTFKELMNIVSKKEPGNNYYELHRSREEEGTYVVMEQYVDQAALDAHGKSDEFKSTSAKLGGCLAGAPEIKLFDAV